MAIPTLNSLTPLLNASTLGLLGDLLGYDGDTINGFVDHAEQVHGGIGAVEQDITVQISIADVPTRPGGSNRITLPSYAGRIFKPVGVSTDDSGTFWVFALKEMPDA